RLELLGAIDLERDVPARLAEHVEDERLELHRVRLLRRDARALPVDARDGLLREVRRGAPGPGRPPPPGGPPAGVGGAGFAPDGARASRFASSISLYSTTVRRPSRRARRPTFSSGSTFFTTLVDASAERARCVPRNAGSATLQSGLSTWK